MIYPVVERNVLFLRGVKVCGLGQEGLWERRGLVLVDKRYMNKDAKVHGRNSIYNNNLGIPG